MSNSSIKGTEAPVAEVFIWKWATNPFRGDLWSIITALHVGQPHPALTTFEVLPVIAGLEVVLADIRKKSPGLLTCLQEVRLGDTTIAILVRLVGQCDVLKAVKALGLAATSLGLTGSSAHKALLLRGALPKHTALKFDNERVETPPQYDLPLDGVLQLLGRVDVRKGICYAVLEGAGGDYVQVYGCDGQFCVEWRTYRDRTWLNYSHVTAGRRPRSTKQVLLGDSNHHITAFKHELLARTDVERIFTAFYRGEKRPHDYTWRNITGCLEALEGKSQQANTQEEGAG
ncbi:MAG: hypothetical protein PCFJNLEI_00673 [Verrucomicrobiae bacterium]|nr:hypothetical protein [Verrucomicrobiae bacterium]